MSVTFGNGNEALTVPPLFIMDVAQASSNQLGFLCSTVPGVWYKLQSVDTVTAGNWADRHVVQVLGELTAFGDTIPSSNRFYRVRIDQ